MSNFGNNGSVTFQKKRYNDDFGLKILGYGTTSQGGQKLDSLHTFPEIASSKNWAISFFLVRNGSDVYLIVDTRYKIGEGNAFNIFSTTTSVVFRINLGSGIEYASTFNYTFRQNILYHIVFNYNTSLQQITCFINSQKRTPQTFPPVSKTFANDLGNVSCFGRFAPNNQVPANFTIREFASFDRELTQNEIDDIYYKNSLPSTTHESCRFHIPFNNVAVQDKKERIRKTLDVSDFNNSGVLFNTSLNINDEFTIINNQTYSINTSPTRFCFGFTNNILAGLFNVSGIINKGTCFTILNGTYQIFKNTGSNVITNTTIQHQNTDVLKIKIITSTSVEFYVNNVLVRTETGFDLSDCKLFCSIFDSNRSPVSQIKKNGISLHNNSVIFDIQNVTINDYSAFNVVENYNYAKTVPIPESDIHHLGFSGFTNEELGISGTTTFTAYSDFYTKNLGANFSGSGDSVFYKLKELRYYGLNFEPATWLSIANFNPTKEKGYTIIIQYKNQQGGYLLNKNNGVIEFRESVNNAAIAHFSFYPYEDGQEFTIFSYNNAQNRDNLNFITSKLGPAKTATNPNTIGLISLNVATETLSDGGVLGKGFDEIGGLLTIGKNANATANFYDGIITYLAIYKGILDNEECKRLFNNGLLMNAWDLSPITQSELVLFPDFNNPFDDAGTLKIPDLSPENHTILAHGWADLPALQNSRVVINSLR